MHTTKKKERKRRKTTRLKAPIKSTGRSPKQEHTKLKPTLEPNNAPKSTHTKDLWRISASIKLPTSLRQSVATAARNRSKVLCLVVLE
jgi:hypothetical protein